MTDDERDDRDDEKAPDDASETPPESGETDEVKGLGLTEEFARLESEIEREASRGETRFDETDSSEWAPPPLEAREDEDEGSDDEEPEAEESDEEDEPDAAEDEPDAAEDEPDAAEDEEPDDEPEADAATDPPTEVGIAAADAPAIEHTVVRDEPVPIPPGGYRSPPPVDEDEIKDRTPALWWRFMAGSVMIIAATAAAVAVSGLLAINGIADDLQPIKFKDDGVLTTIDPGKPQTILIVGSDKRSNTPGDPGRSDTTMLLRVDSDNEVLSLFSLPRDLKVDIAGANFSEAKLNEAYTDGGIEKTTETVKNLTGLDINHVVNVDFQGFADAVDAIDCVYVDVDRKYFNDNSTALSELDQYAPIDVNAGYQRLCGQNALDYVRYRHTDNDFVRAARQQDFLRNARAQVPVSEVLPIIGGDTGSNLLDIFTKYTSSDIHDPAQLIDVLKSFIGVRDVPIKEVHFNGQDTIENGISYVTASPESIKKAVDQFLGEEDSAGGPDAGPAEESKDKSKDGGKQKEEDKVKDGSGADVVSTADAGAACGTIDKVQAFGHTSARRLKFPVYVPGVLVPGSCYDDGSRQYDIKNTDDKKEPAYKMVVALNSDTAAGEYYGVMGTTWSDPPILEKKSETRTVDGRDYDLYFDGDRLRIVAFHDDEDNSYWVSNTLLQSLSEDQMMAIATSMDEAHG